MGRREDLHDLRKALGCFATGVTVVTTTAADGRKVGLTANSFSSVSLDPPLILWSLRDSSPNMPAFSQATHFAVNILAANQSAISQRFANPLVVDKFEGLQIEGGLDNVPILPDCVACFECATEASYPVGDHTLFIGRVQRFLRNNRAPLIFCGGEYSETRQLANAAFP